MDSRQGFAHDQKTTIVPMTFDGIEVGRCAMGNAMGPTVVNDPTTSSKALHSTSKLRQLDSRGPTMECIDNIEFLSAIANGQCKPVSNRWPARSDRKTPMSRDKASVRQRHEFECAASRNSDRWSSRNACRGAA